MTTKIHLNIEVTLNPHEKADMDALAQLFSGIGSSATVSADVSTSAAAVPHEEPAPVEASQEPAPVESAEPEPLKKAETDPEQVRRIMDDTRRRLFGDDYEESEDYRSMRRKLNDTFRNIAAELGADKPTLLAPADVERFKRELDTLQVDVEAKRVFSPLPY